MRWQTLKDDPCALARGLAVVGERWTFLILRDCFLGVRRFDAFQEHLGISRTTLRDRLNQLVAQKILIRCQYEERPPRYEYRLTEMGRALHPVMISLAHWAETYLPDDKGPLLYYKHKKCGADFHPVLTCSECAEPITARDVETREREGFGTLKMADCS